MANTDISSRFYILHLEIAHGSDRFDIHIHMERPPLVRDLMEEVEKKVRVPLMNQQLLYRGQRLHQEYNAPLEKFGLFNGNRIVLVGDKLIGIEDEHFCRLLSIEKDVLVIDDVLALVSHDFENLKQNRSVREEYQSLLRDIQARGERCRSDLTKFQTLTSSLKVESSEPDAFRKKNEVNALIRNRLDTASNLIAAIETYGSTHN